MRLIDANKLEEKVREYFKEKITRGVYAVDTVNCSVDICRMVEEQPTACDVEQVVRELEDLKMRYFLTIANTGDADKDCAYLNTANAIDRAIEIVKQGGRDEDYWK